MIRQYFTKKRVMQLLFSSNISRLAFVNNSSNVSKRAKVNRFVKLNNVQIDAYSYVGPSSELTNCKIGKFCSISSRVIVGLGTHPINFISTSPIFFSPYNGTGVKWCEQKVFDDMSKETIIGNDVWIGMNAIIMGDLKIGDGSIIATNSVVTKDVPPYAIVGGVPAKVIKYRFDNEIINKLQNIKWWSFSDEEIRRQIKYFQKSINLDVLKTFFYKNK